MTVVNVDSTVPDKGLDSVVISIKIIENWLFHGIENFMDA
jgi:hypothetical protein